MVLTKTCRHQHLDTLAQKLATGIAEQPFGLGVDEHDLARLVDDDDGVGRRFQKPSEQRVSPSQGRIELFHARPCVETHTQEGGVPTSVEKAWAVTPADGSNKICMAAARNLGTSLYTPQTGKTSDVFSLSD